MLITFREGAPADLEEYCFIHCHGELKGALHPGLQFTLGQHRYPVTAVGSVAEDNLPISGGFLLLAITGPGAYSIDRLLNKKW